jgi:hypothetical protein
MWGPKMEIKPRDWKSFKYWLHLGIIAVLVLGSLQLWKGGQMFTLQNLLISTVLIGGSDIFSHTILQID